MIKSKNLFRSLFFLVLFGMQTSVFSMSVQEPLQTQISPKTEKLKQQYEKHKEKIKYAVLGAMAILAAFTTSYFSYYVLFPFLRNLFNDRLDKKIAIGKQICMGDEKRINDHATLKQVKVSYQPDGTSCGYHAPKNMFLIINGLQARIANLAQSLMDNALVQRLFGFDQEKGTWRQLVEQQRRNLQATNSGTDNPSLAELRGNNIEEIIAQERRNHTLLDSSARADFHVIDTPDIIGAYTPPHDPTKPEQGIVDIITPDIVKQMKSNNGSDYYCGIVLGDMKQLSHNKGTSGHWITVVMHKNAQNDREYIIADSKNNYQIDSNNVNKLVNAIETGYQS